jgi:hypothetical protein
VDDERDLGPPGKEGDVKVFFSYRREDSAAYAGRLRDTLVAQLGAESTFLDVSSIQAGEDFQAATGRALDAADVELVVIGPHRLALRPDGASRLSDPDDYVRMEVLHALEREVPVVPSWSQAQTCPNHPRCPPKCGPCCFDRRFACATSRGTRMCRHCSKTCRDMRRTAPIDPAAG